MAGGFPPAKVIIIHGRKVVMDERVSMDHLQSAGKREDVISLSSNRLESSDRKNGTNPFSSIEETVPDGSVKGIRGLHLPFSLRRIWEISLKGRVNNHFFLLKIFLNIHCYLFILFGIRFF